MRHTHDDDETMMSVRPTRDETMMSVAQAMAERSTCQRRKVGAVAVDHLGRVLATGHNGVPMGDPHCTEHPCPGIDFPSGQGLDYCLAVHAEINMLMFCPDVMAIKIVYVTTSPCTQCLRALLNTSCKLIIYRELYDQTSLEWWRSRHRYIHRIGERGSWAQFADGVG